MIVLVFDFYLSIYFEKVKNMGGAIYPNKVFTKYITNASNNI
jgi:uncharacterized membrane protein YoaK (UPF0700 family)